MIFTSATTVINAAEAGTTWMQQNIARLPFGGAPDLQVGEIFIAPFVTIVLLSGEIAVPN